jgi:hypothetical protein
VKGLFNRASRLTGLRAMGESAIVLEDLYFEPDRLPDGVLKGTILNAGKTATPALRIFFTFFDESDKVLGRTEAPIPPTEPGGRARFIARHRLRSMVFFRYETILNQTAIKD